VDDGSAARGDDLRRILGYEDAANDVLPGPGSGGAEQLRRVGPELFVTPFWTREYCDTIVRAAEATGAFAHHPDDPVPGHEVSLAVISPRLFEAVQDDLGVRIWPRLQTEWPYIDFYGLRDVFVIRYAIGEQEHLRIHHDVAQVSASVKLDDGYTGGELDFPRQGFTNADVAVGDLLAWPSLVTHPHRTNRLISGVKHALTIWFELPAV
jgi:hypothetical protein